MLKEANRAKDREIESLSNEYRVREMKLLSEKNKLDIELSFSKPQNEKQLHTVEKKLKTMEEKYKSSLQHIKLKDEFIQSYLTGKIPQRSTDPNTVNSQAE